MVKQKAELAPTTEESSRVYYLPHHAFKTEPHGKIKWRIVFDAPYSEGDSPSLNVVLEMGPNLIPEVLEALLRFREQPVAIIGDM